MSEEQKIIDLENEISFLKDALCEKQKEIEELKKDNDTLSKLVIVNEDKVIKELDLISKDKIREKIKEQRQKYFDIHDEKHSINEICFESTKVEGAVEVLKELLEKK